MEKFKMFADRVAAKAHNAKFAVGALATSALVPVMAVAASAEDGASGTTSSSAIADYSDQIINQFSGAVDNIIPIVVGVLGAGLGIWVIFLGIRLAKKMLGTVSK